MQTLKSTYDNAERLNETPHISLLRDFATLAECDAMIQVAKDNLQRALVSNQSAGVESAGRTNRNCWVPHTHSRVVQSLADRIAETTGLAIAQAESFQIVHYQPGECYAPHYDAWLSGTPAGDRCMADGGQRLITCLLYLNDVESGGETGFPRLHMDVSPSRGDMLLFHNCLVGTNIRHKDSLHEGKPVARGEKWACNLWFRESNYRVRGR